MQITFDHTQQENQIREKGVDRQPGAAQAASNQVKAAGTNASAGVFFAPSDQKNTVYGDKEKKTFSDVMDEMSVKDPVLYKNYMTVMASCMSGEDFQKMTQEGVHPGKVDVRDAVTIMDHIKAVMAQSGVVISGFNDLSDMSLDKLTELTGDEGFATVLKGAFDSRDLPLEEETAQDVISLTNQTMEIGALSDEMKQYLLENDLPLTPDQLYRAEFSAGRGSQELGGGYFADGTSGYYGKRPQEVDLNALEGQIKEIAGKAELNYDETVKQEAGWILSRGILLTPEHLKSLHAMNALSFPLEKEALIADMADALREGIRPKDANLLEEGIYEKAERILGEVHAISDEAVKKAASGGETISIRELTNAQRQIELAAAYQQEQGGESSKIEQTNADTSAAQDDNSFLHAKRVLEEVRLQMTFSANLALLRSNYAIETAPLTELVERLRSLEQEGAGYGISLDTKEQALFGETISKTAEIRQMPAEVLPIVRFSDNPFTLNEIHRQGQVLRSTYEKAGQTYEALMTAPRYDLGDRIRDAFRNIDDILLEEGLEPTEDNRRAVRLLAYNRMELTQDSILNMREADGKLRSVLDQMTPAATLNMIRDGVNPLESTIEELSMYFQEMEDELSGQTEKFSHFLHRLDKSGEISKEERESFIGIYRLIRQIEKGDGKAIGTVVANGQEMSFANLLSAVRTNRSGGISETVDDSFGALSKEFTPDNSISDQIQSYYQTKAAKYMRQIDPEVMHQQNVTADTTWEELGTILEEGIERQREDREFVSQQLSAFRESLKGSDENLEYLLENGVKVTADNLLAAGELLGDRRELYRQIREQLKRPQKAEGISDRQQAGEDIEADFDGELKKLWDGFTSKEEAGGAFDRFRDFLEDRLEEQMLGGEASQLDVRALSLTAKQLSLASQMASQENYELGATIFGELTNVNVKFVHDAKGVQDISASIRIALSDGKLITADFQMKQEKLTGFVGCNDQEKMGALNEKTEEFKASLLLKTGKSADISVIYSDTLLQGARKPVQKNQETGEDQQGREESSRLLYSAVRELMSILK